MSGWFSIHTGLRRAPRLQLVVALVPLILQVACQPKDTRPGLWLRGQASETSATDWSFAADVEEIFIETRPWYGIRHSTTIWCVVLNGALYIGSYGDETKAWERNVARNNEARLGIDGNLYDVTISKVTATALVSALDAAYNRKYDMEEVFGEDTPPWWYYQVGRPPA